MGNRVMVLAVIKMLRVVRFYPRVLQKARCICLSVLVRAMFRDAHVH